jgi:hypothetical protein
VKGVSDEIIYAVVFNSGCNADGLVVGGMGRYGMVYADWWNTSFFVQFWYKHYRSFSKRTGTSFPDAFAWDLGALIATCDCEDGGIKLILFHKQTSRLGIMTDSSIIKLMIILEVATSIYMRQSNQYVPTPWIAVPNGVLRTMQRL